MSPDTALRLAKFFRSTPQLWMNMQASYNLKIEAAAKKDEETVRHGVPLAKLLDGMSIRESVTHLDDRGSVTELFEE